MATKKSPKSYDLKKELPTVDDQKFIEDAQKVSLIKKYCTVKHGCNLGDIIAALAAVKKFHEITQRQVIFCQMIDLKAAYYPGATHPTVNASGEMVCINQPMFDMVKPLIDCQEYIHEFVKYDGQPINLDFDTIRGKTFVNMPKMMIQSWLMYAFPDLAADLSKPWMKLPNKSHPIQKKTRGKVIVNFTERYRNNMMDYFYLKNYAPDLIFSGTEREYWLFCNQWGLTIPRLEINDFLELAYALRGAKFLLSNQSFQWNLASALGVPRTLELCEYAPNCQPFVGEDNYGYYHQVGNEYYFKKLYNEKK